MAMFGANSKENESTDSAETFIGPSVKMEGNFSGDGNVVIEGILIGNLATKGDVRVGANASIEAEIRAKNATIAGKVRGNIAVSNHLTLLGTAAITGEVKTSSLTVEEGATINGKILMGRDKAGKEPFSQEIVSEKPKS